MTNQFVSYDLCQPGQNYEKVAEHIRGLGVATRVHKSLWYVNSRYSAEVGAKHIWQAMDANDKLLVIDVTNETFSAYNTGPAALKIMQDQWRLRVA